MILPDSPQQPAAQHPNIPKLNQLSCIGRKGTYGAAAGDISPQISGGKCSGRVDMSLCRGQSPMAGYRPPQCPKCNCGTCYKVTNRGGHRGAKIGGIGKSIIAQIIDSCPSVHPENYCKTDMAADERCTSKTMNQLDIDKTAYRALTGQDHGFTKISPSAFTMLSSYLFSSGGEFLSLNFIVIRICWRPATSPVKCYRHIHLPPEKHSIAHSSTSAALEPTKYNQKKIKQESSFLAKLLCPVSGETSVVKRIGTITRRQARKLEEQEEQENQEEWREQEEQEESDGEFENFGDSVNDFVDNNAEGK
ncbi:hypothetical protein MMC22_007758 [Lobaria immixta]|nr:hypothetical protein [Lobaria immixta]